MAGKRILLRCLDRVLFGVLPGGFLLWARGGVGITGRFFRRGDRDERDRFIF
jgi:hypothetical protein